MPSPGLPLAERQIGTPCKVKDQNRFDVCYLYLPRSGLEEIWHRFTFTLCWLLVKHVHLCRPLTFKALQWHPGQGYPSRVTDEATGPRPCHVVGPRPCHVVGTRSENEPEVGPQPSGSRVSSLSHTEKFTILRNTKKFIILRKRLRETAVKNLPVKIS